MTTWESFRPLKSFSNWRRRHGNSKLSCVYTIIFDKQLLSLISKSFRAVLENSAGFVMCPLWWVALSCEGFERLAVVWRRLTRLRARAVIVFIRGTAGGGPTRWARVASCRRPHLQQTTPVAIFLKWSTLPHHRRPWINRLMAPRSLEDKVRLLGLANKVCPSSFGLSYCHTPGITRPSVCTQHARRAQNVSSSLLSTWGHS